MSIDEKVKQDLRNEIAELQDKVEDLEAKLESHKRFREALVNIKEEQVVTGNPIRIMNELENQLTASMRNIAIEALESEK